MLMLAISISFCPLTMLLTKGLDTGQEAPQGGFKEMLPSQPFTYREKTFEKVS